LVGSLEGAAPRLGFIMMLFEGGAKLNALSAPRQQAADAAA
jgi:hypothetical protein